MKTQTSSGLLLTLTLTAALVLAARTVPAQDSTGAAQTTPQLSYGVSQIVQLSQAKVGDETIVNYIRNSGSSYGLDANQIVYLKQQGVSDAVINTMLSQPRATQTAAAQPAAATATSTATATATVVTPSAPAVAYVQPAPVAASSTVYVIPDTQTYNYYAQYHPYSPYYYCNYARYNYPYCGPVYYGGYYPSVSFAIGYRGGHWGGYYHGGYRGGGWHR